MNAKISENYKSCSPPVRILDIPGIQKLEDMLRLGVKIEGYNCERPHDPIGDLVKELSQKMFGIQNEDTWFQLPEGHKIPVEGSIEDRQLDEIIYTHDSKFKTLDLCDDDIVDFLKKYGLDFTDNYGKSLQCIGEFAVQAEYAIKGFGGKLPDAKEVSAEKWGVSLEQDAQNFKDKKRAAGR